MADRSEFYMEIERLVAEFLADIEIEIVLTDTEEIAA